MTYPNKSKFIALYKSMSSGHPSAEVGLKSMDEEQKKLFDQFVFDAGAIFLEIRDELDAVIEGLGDNFTDSDPRNWTGVDWQAFRAGIEGHRYEEILSLYAEGKPNIHLLWGEIESRL